MVKNSGTNVRALSYCSEMCEIYPVYVKRCTVIFAIQGKLHVLLMATNISRVVLPLNCILI